MKAAKKHAMEDAFRKRVSVLCPPKPKSSEAPSFLFHQAVEEHKLGVFFQSNFKEPSIDWKTLSLSLDADPFDVGVIASFGHMVPDPIIEHFRSGMLVMHPSLLPKYRGACPIQHAILNQEKTTGTSIIEISKGVFDAGDILYQTRPVEITHSTRFADLSQTLAVDGGEALFEVLRDDETFDRYKMNKRSQSSMGTASKAPFIKKDFGDISFTTLSAE